MAQAAESARTVIMTVDDDPGVSRAVARDLRRRYGQSYRIVRAESGESALEALRELKLRGDLVAVILADYRMPPFDAALAALSRRSRPGRAAANMTRRSRR